MPLTKKSEKSSTAKAKTSARARSFLFFFALSSLTVIAETSLQVNPTAIGPLGDQVALSGDVFKPTGVPVPGRPDLVQGEITRDGKVIATALPMSMYHTDPTTGTSVVGDPPALKSEEVLLGQNPGQAPATQPPCIAGAISDRKPASLVEAPSQPQQNPATPTTPTTGAPPIAEPPLPPSSGAAPVAINYPSSNYGNGTPLSNNQDNVIPTFDRAEQIASQARGVELVEAAVQARNAVVGAAADDQQTLGKAYQNLPIQQVSEYLGRAQQALQNTADQLETAVTSTLDSSERFRFRNTYLNAADKAALGVAMIQGEQNRQLANTQVTAFPGLVQDPSAIANPLARTPSLAEVFGSKTLRQDAATNDALTNRIIMFNGLPDNEREIMLQSLRLAEQTQITLQDGTSKTIPILHNGYIFGGGTTGIDCSSFVSDTLPADVRKGRLTTLDLYAIWNLDHNGKLPKPPLYLKNRESMIRQMADAFTAVDLPKGQPLQIGDLLVYRVPDEPAGHVFIVKNYDPKSMNAKVLEASQSAGTVRERDFRITVHPNLKTIRYGLMALRLKPASNKGCKYKDKEKAAKPGHTASLIAPTMEEPNS